MEQGNKIFAPHYYGLIAELELMADRADTALVSVDAGLALARETGERWTDPFLYRLKLIFNSGGRFSPCKPLILLVWAESFAKM
jgi:hypothetical protein